MANPLVSAIIIFLNGEEFLAEAIDSVLAQDYRPIELLLVDDGSGEGATRLARNYAQRHPQEIRCLEHPGHENRGMSASRNLGVQHALGEYIAFLDADDVWLPEKIGEQVAILAAHPEAALVYGKTQIWHGWDARQPDAKDFFYPLGVAEERVYSAPTMLAALIENRFQTPTTCNALIARAAYLQLGGFEESFRGMYEDQAFFAKLYLRFPTYVSGKVWARYRQHAGNSDQPFSRAGYYRERRRLLEFVHGIADTAPVALDANTRRVIARELWRARHPRLAALRMAFREKWRKMAS